MDELDNGFLKFIIGTEFVQIVHFGLQNTPESFHRNIIDAASHARHALHHAGFIKFLLELFVDILKTTVRTMPNSA